MRLDMQTLGTFNDLAHGGAKTAADSLSQLSSTNTEVDVTRADLVPIEDISGGFGEDPRFVGVEIGFEGGMEGSIVLVFDDDSATTLLERVVPTEWDTSADLDRSSVSETANIMVGGFVDAWADHFETKIALGPPTFVAGGADEIIPGDVPVWDARQTALTFTSQLRVPGEDGDPPDAIDFHIYMFPERESFASVVEQATSETDLPLSLDKLSTFNAMTRIGAGRAAEKAETMTGLDIDVDVGRTTFVPAADIRHHVTSARRIGAVAELQAAPGGFVAIMFDEHSARTVGDALLPMEIEEAGVTDQHRNAIEEVGNIMTSGFIDGWANALDRRIQHHPPTLVDDAGSATLTDLVGRLEGDEEYAFLLDSTVRADGQEVNCNLFAVPEAAAFREVIEEMSMDAATAAVDDPKAFEPDAIEDFD